MIGDEYIRLVTVSASGGILLPDRSKDAIKNDPKHCSACMKLIDRSQPYDIKFEGKSAGPEFIAAESGTGVGAIRNSVLNELGVEFEKHGVLLGKVINEEGRIQGDWSSYLCKTIEPVRNYTRMHMGRDLTYYRCCDECGDRYYSEGTNKAGYLVQNDTRNRDQIFQCNLSGLLIPTRILNGRIPKRRRGMGVYRIRVQEKPMDGYPAELICPPPLRPWDTPAVDEPYWMKAKRRRDQAQAEQGTEKRKE